MHSEENWSPPVDLEIQSLDTGEFAKRMRDISGSCPGQFGAIHVTPFHGGRHSTTSHPRPRWPILFPIEAPD
jgi:hypothetical protein